MSSKGRGKFELTDSTVKDKKHENLNRNNLILAITHRQ